MKWASNLLYRNKRFSLFVLGILVSLLLFALQLNQKAVICRIVQTAFYSPYWSVADKVEQLLNVYELNAALQQELIKLRFERIRYEEERVENEQFREMLQFLPRPEYDIIPAHVFAYDQGRRLSSLVIKGNRDLKPFLPVVDRNGLVGKISAATGRVAAVSLLTGPNCRVAARDKETRALGVVKWQAGRGLYFDNVALDVEVVVGDTLISSGLGGVFPEGLIVGIVSSVSTSPTRFFKEIRVKSAVDFGSLDNVMVLFPKEEESAD
jgi:rod shape-determining protein MreC